jgi:Uma2 family endonuclease
MQQRAESVRFTYEDLLSFPEDGKRHELIDGDHYVSAAPSTRHQTVAVNLTWLLRSFLEEHPLGIVFAAPTDVIITDFDVVEPDLVVVAAEHRDRVSERGVEGPPDLAIEILSESTRKVDEVTKRKLFERAGVAEYWIVDPLLEIVKVHRRDEVKPAELRRIAELSLEAGEALTTPLLPGLRLALAEVFADPLRRST